MTGQKQAIRFEKKQSFGKVPLAEIRWTLWQIERDFCNLRVVETDRTDFGGPFGPKSYDLYRYDFTILGIET